MTPKSLLRHKGCVSALADMGPGTSFHRVLDDTSTSIDKKKVKRVVISTGKVYYDLLDAREKAGLDNVKLVRLEQIYPFPKRTLAKILKDTPEADVIWCQEEPKNMGSWSFVRDFLEESMAEAGLQQSRPSYAGRIAAASPATGSASRHAREQAQLVQDALGLEPQKAAAE